MRLHRFGLLALALVAATLVIVLLQNDHVEVATARPTGSSEAQPAAPDPAGLREENAPPAERDEPAEAGAKIEGSESVASVEPQVVVVITDVLDQPIPHATVEITGEGPLGLYNADADGRCPLPISLAPKSVQLRVSADGFTPFPVRHSLGREIRIQLDRALTVKGRVLNSATGMLVPNATVRVQPRFGGDFNLLATWASDGRFQISGVPEARTAMWTVFADGFVARQEARESLDVDQELSFALDPGTAVSLQLVDGASGLPLSGATVSCCGQDLVTDSSGIGTSTAWLSDSKRVAQVQVRAEGYCTLSGRIVAPQDGADRIRVPMVRSASLEGQVVATEGGSLAGAKVRLNCDPLGSFGKSGSEKPQPVAPDGWSVDTVYQNVEQVTEASGRFVFTGLTPRSVEYSVVVVASGRDSTIHRIERMGEPGTATEIVVPIAALGPTGTASGIVTLNGKPVPGSISWQGVSRNGSAEIDRDGRYRLDGVECGSVSIVPGPHGLFARAEHCRALIEGPWRVDIRADQESVLDIPIALATTHISGRVLDANGAPAPDVAVSAYARDTCLYGEVRTDVDGHFEVLVDSGSTDFQVFATLGVRRTEVNHIAPGARNVELRFRGGNELARLRLRLVDEHSREILTSFAIQITGSSNVQSTFDPEGRFGTKLPCQHGWYMPELPCGRYELRVDNDLQNVGGYLPTPAITIDVHPDAAPLVIERRKGRECLVELAPGQQPWPKDKVTVVLVESRWAEDVGLGPTGWQIGGNLAGIRVYQTRVVKFGPDGRAKVTSLDTGPYRFIAFPSTITIEPAELQDLPEPGEVLQIQWQAK